MKLSEFTSSIRELEVATVASRTDDAEAIEARRMITFKVVRDFPVEVLRAAIVNLCQDPEVKFFPPTPRIYQACLDVSEEQGAPARIPRARFRPAKHACSMEKPEINTALGMLSILSAYEAAHVCCPPDVLATCPVCGKRYPLSGVFDKLIEKYPEQTAKWNPNFKGTMTCEACEERQSTTPAQRRA